MLCSLVHENIFSLSHLVLRARVQLAQLAQLVLDDDHDVRPKVLVPGGQVDLVVDLDVGEQVVDVAHGEAVEVGVGLVHLDGVDVLLRGDVLGEQVDRLGPAVLGGAN